MKYKDYDHREPVTHYASIKKQPRKVIDSREFVKAWMKSKAIDEVASKLGISATSVVSKASNLRVKGVNLPKMQRVVDHNSVDELNKLIDKYSS